MRHLVFATMLLCGGAASANAFTTIWTVQSASSSLTLSGSVSSGGSFLADLRSQTNGNGAMTSFVGTIETSTAALIENPFPPTDFQLDSGDVIALNSGDWDPDIDNLAGTAPASLGMRVDLGFLGGANLAVRDLTASFSSPSFLLVGDAPSPQAFSVAINYNFDSSVDYRSYGVLAGVLTPDEPLVLLTSYSIATNGTIAYDPVEGLSGVTTLTIPIIIEQFYYIQGEGTTHPEDDIILGATWSGQFVATAVVPEASSLVLLGLAASSVGFLGYRRSVPQR